MASRTVLKLKIEQLIEQKNEYDSALKSLEILRTKKNNTEEEVGHLLQTLKMEGKTIIVNNQKIFQKKISSTQGLTFKYIQHALEQYNKQNDSIKNYVNTKELLEFIKHNRPKYIKTEIKID
jgi:hypothetical protein